MSAKWDGTNLTKQILPLRKAPPSKVYYVFFAYIATSGYVTPTSHLYSTSFIELKDAPAGADHTGCECLLQTSGRAFYNFYATF